MNSKSLLLAYFFILLVSCKEKYNPAIDNQMNAIIVDGLISNLRVPYKVKIYKASPFDSLMNRTGVLGAKVSIRDDKGNSYKLHETPLYYYSDTSEFIAVTGRSYTLHIEMPDGNIYESSTQKLTTAASVDSIYGKYAKKEFWYENPLGGATSIMDEGPETFMDLSYDSDSIRQFRFVNTVIYCYSYEYLYTESMRNAGKPFPPDPFNPCVNGPPCPYIVYCWEKINILGTNLTSTTNNIVSNKLKNSTVCFFSKNLINTRDTSLKLDSCTYNINGQKICGTIKVPAGFGGNILYTRVYALNHESSVFYEGIKTQLSNQGKLFDPVAVQLIGNIKCISNPNKLAFGLFEVSPCIVKTYWITFSYSRGKVIYQPIRDLTQIPEIGHSQTMPDYWLQ